MQSEMYEYVVRFIDEDEIVIYGDDQVIEMFAKASPDAKAIVSVQNEDGSYTRGLIFLNKISYVILLSTVGDDDGETQTPVENTNIRILKRA
jgi:hypothetical protein